MSSLTQMNRSKTVIRYLKLLQPQSQRNISASIIFIDKNKTADESWILRIQGTDGTCFICTIALLDYLD